MGCEKLKCFGLCNNKSSGLFLIRSLKKFFFFQFSPEYVHSRLKILPFRRLYNENFAKIFPQAQYTLKQRDQYCYISLKNRNFPSGNVERWNYYFFPRISLRHNLDFLSFSDFRANCFHSLQLSNHPGPHVHSGFGKIFS